MRVDYDGVEMVVVSVVLVGASAAWYSAVDPLVMKVKAAAGGIMRCGCPGTFSLCKRALSTLDAVRSIKK